MFVSPTRRVVDHDALASLSERIRPVSSPREWRLPLHPVLSDLLPEGLRRGTTVGIKAAGEKVGVGGGTSLALLVMTAASQSGSWCAVVGLDDLGVQAAEQFGIELSRLIVVPTPGIQWARAVSDLLEGVDLVILQVPSHPRGALARRLVARVRDRRGVLVVLDERGSWPESCDVVLRVESAQWVGFGRGEDCLRRRWVGVSCVGRREGGRVHSVELWLPPVGGAGESESTAEAGFDRD